VAGEDSAASPSGKRDDLLSYLSENGISAKPGTHSVPLLGYYKEKYNLFENQFPNALSADRHTITLPLFPSMTHSQQARVTSTLSAYKY
jgi:dTDP-4-amino-4,6-dideoxygalactose transaminase